MGLLLIGSIIVTAAVWSNAGPVWGLITGFLLIGGAGWKLLAGLVGLAIRPFRPGWGEFVRAWELRVGDPRRGGWDVPDNEVVAMHRAYAEWRQDKKQTDEWAGAWLDRMLTGGRSKTEFSRHVPLYKDGKGATFELRYEHGEPKWSWSYDPGTPDNFNTMMMTEMALTRIEKELDLPLTFPHWDPDKPPEKPKPLTPEDKAQRLLELEERADDGDPHAKARLWELDGRAVTEPRQLTAGHIYCMGYDLGVYRRSFVGRRWEGYPDIDNEPEVKEWFEFELAESGMERLNHSRLAAVDLQPKTREDGEIDYSVVDPPAPQQEVRLVFDELREQHRDWERRRGPDRFF
jgi:hypothetical protein